MTLLCLPADPAREAPRFQMPAGATDSHAHVIGLPPDYPFVDDRSYTPPEASLADYEALHRALGIERAVIVTPSICGTDNRMTLKAIADYAGQARGVSVLDETVGDSKLEALHEAGIRGVRLNILFAGGVGLQAFKPLADRIRDLGWHVQLLINIAETLNDLAPQMPSLGLPIVIDHMGHMPVTRGVDDPAFQTLVGLLKDGICWSKLSGNYRISTDFPHYPDAIPFAKALIDAAEDCVVWGTDWPHVAQKEKMPNDTDLLNALDDYAPTAALKQKILVDNPARLYGFE